MSEIHQIGELLRAGVKPSKEEVEHLADLGAFVASMFGRYLHGARSADFIGATADDFASSMGGRLGAMTGTRWEQGFGLSEQLLSSEWSGWWQVGRSGFAPGYDWADFERATLELYEEVEAATVHEASPEETRRRGSLFGRTQAERRRARRAAGTPAEVRRSSRSGAASARRARTLAPQTRWADGALVDLTTLDALERGGLFVGDQIAAVDAMSPVRTSRPGAREVRTVPSSEAAPRTPRTPRALLDGVLVDERTPALASALSVAEAAFGAHGGSSGLSVTATRTAEMTSASPMGAARGVGQGARPVFAFYDAVEGDFVALAPEDAPSAAPAPAVERQRAAPRASLFAAKAAGTSPHVGGTGHTAEVAATAVAARRPEALVRHGGTVAVRLDRIAGSENRGRNTVRPYTAGVFGTSVPEFSPPLGTAQVAALGANRGAKEGLVAAAGGLGVSVSDRLIMAADGEQAQVAASAPGARVASARGSSARQERPLIASGVTYDRAGRPQARVQRSALGAPRIATTSVKGYEAPRELSPTLRGERALESLGVPDRTLGGERVTAAAEGAGLASGARAWSLAAVAAQTAGVSSGAVARWLSAMDLGPDLPLGATLSRAEEFGALAATQGASRSEWSVFAPTIARAGGQSASNSAGFSSRAFTDAVDGVVWVAPEASETVTAVEAAMGRMPLAVVPRGRAAAQMPIAQALAMGAVSAAKRTVGAAEQAATRWPGAGEHEVRQAGAGAPEVRRADSGERARAFDAAVRAQLRSGLVSGPRPVVGQDGAGAVELLGGRLGHGSTSLAKALRSVVGEAGREAGRDAARTTVESFATVARLGADAPARGALTRDLTDGGAQVAPGRASDARRSSAGEPEQDVLGRGVARPEFIARQLRAIGATGGSTSLIARWLQGMLAGSPELAAPSRVFGAGAYARLDAERENVRLVGGREEAQAGSDASVATPTARRVSSKRVTSSGMKPGAGQARVQDAASKTDRTPSAASRNASHVARAALTALRRPVVTARETREVAPLVQSIMGLSGLGSAAGREMEPVLSRAVLQRGADVANLASTGRDSGASVAFLGAVAALGRSEARRVAEVLRSSGWTTREMEMLSLNDEGVVDATAVASAPASRTEALAQLRALQRTIAAVAKASLAARSAAGASPSAWQASGEATKAAVALLGAGVSARSRVEDLVASVGGRVSGRDALSVMELGTDAPMAAGASEGMQVSAGSESRLGRNLARVLSGAEVLGGPVGGATSSASASGMATGFMPMISAARPDRYFGGAAPERRGGYGQASLRDAVGELVAIAAEMSASSDTVVDASAKGEVLRRVLALRDQGAASAPAVRATLAQVVAAGADVGALSRALVAVPVAERAQALALARASAPSVMARLEREIAEGRAQGLGHLLAAREPVASFDASRLGATAGGVRPTLAGLLGAGETTLVAGVEQASSLGGPEVAEVAARQSSVATRLEAALANATRGPAGARRLLRPLAGAVGAAEVVGTGAREGGRAVARVGARHQEFGVPAELAAVMAPEAMLTGMRSAEVSEAVKAGLRMATGRLSEAPGVFATLADSGVDMSSFAATVTDGIVSRRGGAPVRGTLAAPAGGPAGARSVAAGTAPAASRRVLGGDPVQVLLQLVGRDPATVGRVLAGGESSGLSRQSRSGLLSAIVRGADRREVASLFQQAGASEFAFAWLNRVDGTRSGLDLGLGGTRTEMGRAFGQVRQVSSRVAGESPIGAADFVAPMMTEREDRSGLRSLAAHAGSSRTGRARPQHGASAALRRTDWRFVDTGSRAQTPHADLGKLAAAIVSNNQAAARAPLPLIAPAAKAVAQTALLSAKSDAKPAAQTKSRPKPGGGGQAQQAQGLSEEAMEQLAIEMASRVAQIMGRNKERIGVWQ